MKLKVLVLAAALSFGTGIGCTYKPARVAAPQPLPPPATQPAVAPEDQPPSPNAMTDLVITAEPTPTAAPKALVVLLPNQYPGMPPRIGKVLQYCARVCTDNWSGSMFGGARNPSNICMGKGLQDDGTTPIFAHITQSNPDGFRMDTQLAPDGSRCVYEAPQCTVGNGCLSAEEKKQCPSCGG